MIVKSEFPRGVGIFLKKDKRLGTLTEVYRYRDLYFSGVGRSKLSPTDSVIIPREWS